MQLSMGKKCPIGRGKNIAILIYINGMQLMGEHSRQMGPDFRTCI